MNNENKGILDLMEEMKEMTDQLAADWEMFKNRYNTQKV